MGKDVNNFPTASLTNDWRYNAKIALFLFEGCDSFEGDSLISTIPSRGDMGQLSSRPKQES